MIKRILAGTATAEDIETAREYEFADRKKLLERLVGALDNSFVEVLVLNGAIDDAANALAQARPVFAAGLSTDMALGFIIKMVEESIDSLEESGEMDTEEYDKQETVKEMLEGFVEACESTGTTEGEDAFETVHLEYRGECAKLEALRNDAEAEIANSLAFVKEAYGEGNELSACLKGIERNVNGARFMSKFGSPSFFTYKHVAAPGEKYATSGSDSEAD